MVLSLFKIMLRSAARLYLIFFPNRPCTYLFPLEDVPFLNIPDNRSFRSFLLPLTSESPAVLMSESDPPTLWNTC